MLLKNSLVIFILSISFTFSTFTICQTTTRTFSITKKYLNFPVQSDQEHQNMKFIIADSTLTYSVIRLANESIDYWVFKDVSSLKGRELTIQFDRNVSGIEKIYASDLIDGQDSLYKEKNRPQFHFTSRRGWNNDPNGLVYHNGEYHLYYQHNPFERNWENMHWGHAVSKDLLHWEELPDALYPDEQGIMYSGSAVIDKNNTSGWGKDVIVAAYTAAAPGIQTQCVAYSKDNGRSFIKYEKNPVVNSHDKWKTPDTRDPKIFWYEPNLEWVMVLFELNGHSIYTSKNLKEWQFESHLVGFWECPELFELPVDGDQNNKKWVMYGASGTYMTGEFDGKRFIPDAGKYRTAYGSIYAAQTYNNTPDGRRIQIGWGTVEQPGMPFNQMMLFPTELTLRTTKEGVRLFSNPVKEIEKLHNKEYVWNELSLNEANDKLNSVQCELVHLKAEIELIRGLSFSINYRGNRLIEFDGNFDRVNGYQYIQPEPGKYIFEIEILIDKTSVEVFLDGGKLVDIFPLKSPGNNDGLKITASENELIVRELKLYEMKSIWQ